MTQQSETNSEVVRFPANRLHIVEVNNDKKQKYRRRKKKRQPAQVQKNQQVPENFPLEMQPVLRAVKDYARMTAALGAKAGADELERLVSRIRALNPEGPIKEILNDTDARIKRLNDAFVVGYGGQD